MSRHSEYDHELLVGSTTDRFKLMRDENNVSMYRIETFIPNYRNPLVFEQRDWKGGHGQYQMKVPDMYFEGQSIDTTEEGRIFLGAAITSVLENDDTALDAAPIKFCWFPATSEWLCATSGKIYRYRTDDTAINTNEAVDTTETGIDVTPDATTAIPVNSIILIDSELMLVDATGTTLTVTRAYGGTTAATHNTATDIFIYKWTAVTTTVAGVTDLCVFGTTIFAACGASTAYKYSTDGETWTTSTLNDTNANYFFVAPNSAGTAEVLWKAKTPNELKSNASGINGGDQWSSVAYIGDTSTNITNVFLINDNLVIGKTDGLWHYDSDGGLHQLRPDLADNRSTNNFKYVTDWSAGVYFSEATGMGEVTSRSAYAPMGALHQIETIGKRGDIVGMAADKDFLYVAIDEGTNTHIYKGREIYREGFGLRWEWCPFVFLGTYEMATMRVAQHSASDRRLWFGYTTGSTYGTAYVILSDNPTADPFYRYTTSGFLRTSYDYGSEPNSIKMWQSAVFEVSRINSGTLTTAASGETVALSYLDDTDTSATSIISAATTLGVYETNFSSAINNKRIQYHIALASDTSTATPSVSYFQAKGVEKPTLVRIHEAVYTLANTPVNKVKTLRDLLRTAATSTSLVRFADLRYNGTTGGTAGTDYVNCVIEPGYPQEVEIVHLKGNQPELGIKIRMREVSFS